MVIVKLMGGLGNQMFQYATARALAEKIYFDHRFLNNNNTSSDDFTPRSYELQIFKKIKAKKINSYLLRLLLSKNKKYKLLKNILSFKITNVNDDNVNEILTKQNLTESLFLDGYFQNSLYFNQIRNSIINEFTFPKLADKYVDLLNEIEHSESVAIHVRRGDYLKQSINKYHGVLPLSYYQDAVNLMENKFTQPTYYIFSDDPAWCAENLTFLEEKKIISKENDAWIDMFLISKCKHQIIANSSFSWWGAWLNQNVKKMVIAPKKWFSSAETNIVPKEWISL